jgi:hypothetical protein
MRFNKAEKEAFTVGTAIEWRNGRHWHAGTVVSGISRPDNFEYIKVRNDSRSGGVMFGEVMSQSPTHIRLPQPPAVSS